MRRTIMTGQRPVDIEGNENVGQLASSSGIIAGQASPENINIPPPADAMPNASDGDIRDDEDDHKSGEDNQDGDHADNPRRKSYHRHTPQQIHEMEEFFERCPNPKKQQKVQLGQDLGLDPSQVGAWFQNRRVQQKAHIKRERSAHLKLENAMLRAENAKYKAALASATCFTCRCSQANDSLGRDQLRAENIWLKEKIAHLTGLTGEYVGQPNANNNIAPSSVGPSSSVNPDITDKTTATVLVNLAMEELIRMAEIEYPLWIPIIDDKSYLLNQDAYHDMFPGVVWQKIAGFNVEASKGTDIVRMNHLNLTKIFMDMDKWLAVFANIVSRAFVVELISEGSEFGSCNGALLKMTAEYQTLTPIIPTRESLFLRCCKQLGKGKWGIVDVSFNHSLCSGPLGKCQRRPSGCIIQELPNNCSKVIWIEHVQVQDESVQYLGKPFVESGFAFGAPQWISTLTRQCEHLASAMQPMDFSPYSGSAVISPEGRKNILKLSERMMRDFYGAVTSSTAYEWWNLTEDANDQIRIMTKKNENDPGKPSGVALSATISIGLPISQKLVYDYLRDTSTRVQWDIHFDGGNIQEIMQITNESGSCVSFLQGPNTSRDRVLLLQECSTHPTGSYVTYAAVDPCSMDLLLAGGNPDEVALLPSGFTIYPDWSTHALLHGGAAGNVGCILTISFQIFVHSIPTAHTSVPSISVINKLMEYTSQKIRAALTPHST